MTIGFIAAVLEEVELRQINVALLFRSIFATEALVILSRSSQRMRTTSGSMPMISSYVTMAW